MTVFAVVAIFIASGTTDSEAAPEESETTAFTCTEDYGVARVIYDIDRRAPFAVRSEAVDDLYFAVLQMFGENPTTGVKEALADVEILYEDAETIVYVAAEGAVEFGVAKINESALPQYLAVCGSLVDAVESLA